MFKLFSFFSANIPTRDTVRIKSCRVVAFEELLWAPQIFYRRTFFLFPVEGRSHLHPHLATRAGQRGQSARVQ